MARVCTEKGTGKLIEYQSDATEGTLISNAVNAGYKANTVEEKEVTDEEWAALRETHITGPARQHRMDDVNERTRKREAIRARLGLTDDEMQDLMDVTKG